MLEWEKTSTERVDSSHTTDTSEEDDPHAVITVHPNKDRKREKINRKKKKKML